MPGSRSEYAVLGVIGTGTFGTCTKVRRRSDGKVFVWKELNYGPMSEREKQMLVSEVNLLREFRHPHIVRYVDRIIERESTTIYIVMEFCENGDLATLIRRHRREKKYVDEAFVWKVLAQLLTAIHECHQRKDGTVLHRDLKPANVFLDRKMNAKLGDFGLARVLSCGASLAQTYVGTPYYMSPEQISEHGYNTKSDIWSLGCLIYELAALVPPFDGPTKPVLEARIRDGRIHRLPGHFSDPLNSTIRSMLQQEPHRRPTTAALLANPHIAARLAQERPLSPSSQPSSIAPLSPDSDYASPSPHRTLQGAARPPGTPGQHGSPSHPSAAPTEARLASPSSRAGPMRESDLRAWEDALRRREEQLRSREEEIQRREDAVAARERLAAVDSDTSFGTVRRLRLADKPPL